MAEPLIPRFAARPQGGGSAPVGDRAVLTAIVYVLTGGRAWRHLPPLVRGYLPTTIAWRTGYRRMTIRYERRDAHFAGFLHLAAALSCFKKLPT